MVVVALVVEGSGSDDGGCGDGESDRAMGRQAMSAERKHLWVRQIHLWPRNM